MKIFITGERGFIGRHLYRALLAQGHELVTDRWRLKVEKFDLVIHLAATTHILQTFDQNIFNNNIVYACEIMNTPFRTLYASSCSAAHLTNPYAYTKRFLEHLGDRHGNAMGFRFFNVYGPENNKGIVKYLMDQEDGATVTIRGPELIRDYIHIDDVVRSIMANIPGMAIAIDYGALRKLTSELRASQIIEMFKHSGIYIGPEETYKPLKANVGVAEIGTGIGTRTIDLVNLYMKISGKRFVLRFGEHGQNEPESMVASIVNPRRIQLEEGLIKTINAHEVINSSTEL